MAPPPALPGEAARRPGAVFYVRQTFQCREQIPVAICTNQGGVGRGMMDQATGQMQNTYGRAKDTARDMTDQAMEMGERYYDQGTRAIRDSVQNQPIGSLLIAAAAGFALAWMIQGRND